MQQIRTMQLNNAIPKKEIRTMQLNNAIPKKEIRSGVIPEVSQQVKNILRKI